MEKKKCDVLIFGAGPAGGIAAATISKKGFSVICVEKGKVIGSAHSQKIDITENKGIDAIIKEFDLNCLAESKKSIWFSPNDKFTFVSSVKDLFFLRGTSKKSLDYSIFRAMKKNGVDVWIDSCPIKLNFENKKIKSIIVKKNRKNVMIEPKIIVVATGSDTFFEKKLGLVEIDPIEIVAFGALVSGLRMENNSTNIFLDSRYAPGGYFFVGKTSKNMGVAMIVANKALLKTTIRNSYYNFIEENSELFGILFGSKVIIHNGGQRTLSMISERVVGNVAFCGDAARTMSPVFAYGINPAMNSGRILAESIIKYGATDASLKKYSIGLKKYLGNEKQRHFFRKIYDKLSNADFDFLIDSAKYLHSRQHLDDLIDSEDYKARHLIFAIIRKPHKTIRITAKIAAKMLIPFY